MTKELKHPLPTLLDRIAVGMNKDSGILETNMGRKQIWDWQTMMRQQGELVVPYLRRRLEAFSRSTRTIRVAGADLVPERVVGMLLFTVVVCNAPRPEGEVRELRPGDMLYTITAADAFSHTLVLRWMATG